MGKRIREQIKSNTNITTLPCGVGACAGNTGASTCSGGVEGNSCDPMGDAAVNDSTCDGVDDDCDGVDDEDAGLPAGWWNAAYPYRTRLSFDNAGAANSLGNFPVLVVLELSPS